MRKFFYCLPICVVMFSCNRTTSSNVATTKYYHKYGFEVPKSEWEKRDETGKVMTTDKSGVTVIKTYEHGILNGPTTISYPNTDIIQKKLVYDQGVLLKEIIYDENSTPIRESNFEFEDKILKTCWDEQGAPISIEEFKGNLLFDGKYYDKDLKQEASVTSGNGHRVKRSRQGILLQKEVIEKGKIVNRICFYPNGTIQSETNYINNEPHGLQKKYTESGNPLTFIEWNEGVLHGMKTHFSNGKKSQQIPYEYGMKHGIEQRYDDHEKLCSEIPWEHGQRHGKALFLSDEHTTIQWYYKDKQVTENQYESFENRSKVVADLTSVFSSEKTS